MTGSTVRPDSTLEVSPPPTGLVFELGPGWMANTRVQHFASFQFREDQAVTPERVFDSGPQIFESGSDGKVQSQPKL